MEMNQGFAKRGLYAVTPGGRSADLLVEQCHEALLGGAVWLQYRAKPGPDPVVAHRLKALCETFDACFIVNDDVELATDVGADGVHLGREDGDPAAARRRLGPRAVIGVSCHDDLRRAAEAVRQGASYLAFGSVFASPTKPDAVRCSLKILGAARHFDRPVVAIGGITAANAADAIAAGADLVAVISDLFEAPDIERRAGQFARLFG